MSMDISTVSTTARRRINRFSAWVWAVGAVILFVNALIIYDGVGVEEVEVGDGGRTAVGDDAYPWDLADPPLFEADGTTYSGAGNGLISIPLEDHDEAPYLLTMLSEGYVSFSITEAEDLDLPDDDQFFPNNIGSVFGRDDTIHIVPNDADLELWVQSDDPWEFTLAQADVEEITDGFISGQGPALLAYRGDAVSAQFVHTGDGTFTVTVQLPGTWGDTPIIAFDEVNERLSWDPTDDVYFAIDADDETGAWSVDIDELAKDARPSSSTTREE